MNIEIESLVFFDAAQVTVRREEDARDRMALAEALTEAADLLWSIVDGWEVPIDEAKLRAEATRVAVLACRVVMAGVKEPTE